MGGYSKEYRVCTVKYRSNVPLNIITNDFFLPSGRAGRLDGSGWDGCRPGSGHISCKTNKIKLKFRAMELDPIPLGKVNPGQPLEEEIF